MPSIESIGQSVGAAFKDSAMEFQPVLHYNKRFGFIEARLWNCSYIEEIISNGVSILTDNYPESSTNAETGKHLVGFRVWVRKDSTFFKEFDASPDQSGTPLSTIVEAAAELEPLFRKTLEIIAAQFPPDTTLTIA